MLITEHFRNTSTSFAARYVMEDIKWLYERKVCKVDVGNRLWNALYYSFNAEPAYHPIMMKCTALKTAAQLILWRICRIVFHPFKRGKKFLWKSVTEVV